MYLVQCTYTLSIFMHFIFVLSMARYKWKKNHRFALFSDVIAGFIRHIETFSIKCAELRTKIPVQMQTICHFVQIQNDMAQWLCAQSIVRPLNQLYEYYLFVFFWMTSAKCSYSRHLFFHPVFEPLRKHVLNWLLIYEQTQTKQTTMHVIRSRNTYFHRILLL